ncbi:hypothetical protein [Clostridium beijerinckii]|uniref:Translation initiation factor 2 alpha subunit (eIF-2alpha) n=1 Tax=Clostridium beijerinckii TaxID=1520 RepID=A0AAE5LSR1_CLOBE|nr:hypothetical protein [Clostridium beijerinckii]NSB17418.1 translation initiation factor 2 alpha subunit (eIF-2alpha) [Clostridium beijerinckii]OOM28470.1 hypothetical protein CLOBE_27260 [Clostridium beijerinckii]
MNKKVYELLEEIKLQSEKINNWEQMTDIFANAIKRKGLNTEEVEEISERISREFKKNKDTFDEMIKAGEEFKEALELSDGDVYELLKRDNNEERYCTVAESLEQSLKEMQLIREGKLPKKTWRQLRERLGDE